MARRPDDTPRKRFTRSGHTSHQPRVAPGGQPPRGQAPAAPPRHALPPPPNHYAPEHPQAGPPDGYEYDPYGSPTYHHGGRPPEAAAPSSPAVAITRAAF